MVGHHLKLEYFDLRMVGWYVPPFISDGAAQRGQFYTGVVAVAIDTAKQVLASFNSKRHHVNSTPGVVVSHKAPFHRWYLFAGKGFSLLVGVLVHICKDNYISSYLQLFRTFFT